MCCFFISSSSLHFINLILFLYLYFSSFPVLPTSSLLIYLLFSSTTHPSIFSSIIFIPSQQFYPFYFTSFSPSHSSSRFLKYSLSYPSWIFFQWTNAQILSPYSDLTCVFVIPALVSSPSVTSRTPLIGSGCVFTSVFFRAL